MRDSTTTAQRNGKLYKRGYVLQPAESAKAAGLRYVSDASPGIRRTRAGDAFRYVAADGRTVRDSATLLRIRRLAIPPAWTEVWICPREDGHLQATGRDARGRKQYRYHPRWRDLRDETKYGRMLEFARSLPRIHRQVGRHLALPGLPREKALAAVVRLLEATQIRVGNQEYARDNESYGLTTLRNRQVRVRGERLRFRFRGKSGVRHDVELTDRQVARIVSRMQDLPGEELFRYVDESGAVHTIESADVNAYLREIASGEFTSKDFRTWSGTVHAAEALARMPAASQAEVKRNIVHAVESAAARLGNTKAVCRKCYIHPAVFEAYSEGRLAQAMAGRRGLAAIVALLRSHAARERQRAGASGADGRPLTPLLRKSIAISRRSRSAPPNGQPRATRPRRHLSRRRFAAPSPGASARRAPLSRPMP